MTIPVSSVPAVRAYLIAAITAQVTAANLTEPPCEVYDGEPDHETTADVVAVAGAHRTLKPAALVGGGGQFWKDEDYSVDLIIDCFQAGADGAMAAVHARAYQILALVETAVRSDPSLGGLVLEAYPQDSASVPSWDTAHMGARCEMTAQIHVFNTL